MKATDDIVKKACLAFLDQDEKEYIGEGTLKAMRKAVQAAFDAMPKQEPFSDDTLNYLRQNDNGKLNFVTLREFREVARAVEKAHGIGVSE